MNNKFKLAAMSIVSLVLSVEAYLSPDFWIIACAAGCCFLTIDIISKDFIDEEGE